jgi:hypothetical protein
MSASSLTPFKLLHTSDSGEPGCLDVFQVQSAEIYDRKKHCKVAPQQQETADHTVFLVPGSFDVILLVDKQETAG